MNDTLTLKLDGQVVEVRKDDDGRYCLNDIHKAAGKPVGCQPSHFLRNRGSDIQRINASENTVILPHLVQDLDSHALIRGKGRGASSYGSLNTVYRYAAFISKAFEKSVYEAFTALSKGDVSEASRVAESVAITPEMCDRYDRLYAKLWEVLNEKYAGQPHYKKTNIARLCTTGATGYTPAVLTGKTMSAKDYMIKQDNQPAMSACIATMENVIMMLLLPHDLDYQDIATAMYIPTAKNKSALKLVKNL